jgi:hypothetical protein
MEKTKHPCTSMYLFEHECLYDGIVDEKRDHFGFTGSTSNPNYYHYMDWERTPKEVITLFTHDKKKLCQQLLILYATKKEHWIVNVLKSCGYNVEDKNV